MLIPVHSPKRAGAQLVALGQARALSSAYDLVIAIAPGPLRPEFAQLGDIVRAPTRLPVWGASPARWLLDLARIVPDTVRFAILIRRRGIEVVLCPSTVLVAPVLAARLAGARSIVEAQEAPKSRAARLLLRFHGRFADTVVPTSGLLEDRLSCARARVAKNHVGIALPPKARRPPRSANQPIALLTVGTIDRHKRQDLAIEAVARLHRAGLDVTLGLLGAEADPAYAEELTRLVARHDLERRVRFLGPTADVHPHMLAADVLLLPAGEVTPLVAMEAMARGAVVVAARTGSIAEILGETGGLIVDPDDPDGLASAIAQLGADPARWDRLVVAARARCEDRFDENRSNARLRAIIADTVAPSSSPAVVAEPAGVSA